MNRWNGQNDSTGNRTGEEGGAMERVNPEKKLVNPEKKCPDPERHLPADGMVQEPSGAVAYMENAERVYRKRKGDQTWAAVAGEQEGGKQDPRIPEGGGHTKEDYLSLPDDLRVELIDGVFYEMAAPTLPHQTVLLEIAQQINNCIDRHDAPCMVVIAPSDVELGNKGDTIVQPDVYVRCKKGQDEKRRKADAAVPSVPEFVIEVLSPSNQANDLWRKRELYKRHGVREYWIINPWDFTVSVFDFRDRNLREDAPAEFSFEDEVPVLISDGLCRIDFCRIRQRIQRNEEIAGKAGTFRQDGF